LREVLNNDKALVVFAVVILVIAFFVTLYYIPLVRAQLAEKIMNIALGGLFGIVTGAALTYAAMKDKEPTTTQEVTSEKKG